MPSLLYTAHCPPLTAHHLLPMFVILGGIIVFGCVMAGFMMAGGHIGALIHPSEFVTIGGAAFGALILMTPGKVLKDLMKGILNSLKGSPFNRQAYADLFKLLYDLLRTARRDGLLALDSHVSNPEESEIFNKYPKLAANHHVVEFICGALVPVLD
jgi:chemotaxis protein MotA